MRIFENPVIPFDFEIYQQGKHMAYLANGARIYYLASIASAEGNYILIRKISGIYLIEALFTFDGISVDGRFENIVLEEICCEKDNSTGS